MALITKLSLECSVIILVKSLAKALAKFLLMVLHHLHLELLHILCLLDFSLLELEHWVCLKDIASALLTILKPLLVVQIRILVSGHCLRVIATGALRQFFIWLDS
jgi:hypothetical protein